MRWKTCPVCTNSLVVKGVNDITTTHPEYMKYWDYERNNELGYFPENYFSGEKVEAYMNLQQDILSEIKNFFNNTPNLVQAIKKTIDENVDLKKDVDAYKQEKLQQITDLVIKNAQETNGVKVVLLKGEHSTDAVKTIAFNVRNKIGDSPMAFFAATSQNGKPALTVAFSDSLVNEGYNAVKTVCEAAKEIQGGGGGQPFFAQAGGKNMNGLEKAFEILKNKIG